MDRLQLATSGKSASPTWEIAMYTVAVRWGELVKTHKAWTLSDAKATMYAYPKQDVFIKITNMFGQRVAVRYYR